MAHQVLPLQMKVLALPATLQFDKYSDDFNSIEEATASLCSDCNLLALLAKVKVIPNLNANLSLKSLIADEKKK